MFSSSGSTLRYAIWLSAACFLLYEFFLRAFPGSIAPQIIYTFHLTADAFALISLYYQIPYGLMQIPIGILLEWYGVQPLLLIGMGLCASATLLFGHTQQFSWLLLSRIAMGFGSSVGFISLVALTISTFKQAQLGFFMGMAQLIGTLGGMLGNGPWAVWVLHSQQPWQHAVLYAGGAGCLLTGMTGILFARYRTYCLQQPASPFFSYSTRKDTTYAHLHALTALLSNHQMWYACTYAACVYAPMALFGLVWGTVFLETQHYTQTVAAHIVSLIWIGYACGSPLLGQLSDWLQRRKPVLFACAGINATTLCGIIFFPALIGPLPTAGNAALFFLLGFSAAAQGLGCAVATEQVHDTQRFIAVGFQNTLITVLIAFLTAISSQCIHRVSYHTHAKWLHTGDFISGLSLLPCFCLLPLLLSSVKMEETHCQTKQVRDGFELV